MADFKTDIFEIISVISIWGEIIICSGRSFVLCVLMIFKVFSRSQNKLIFFQVQICIIFGLADKCLRPQLSP